MNEMTTLTKLLSDYGPWAVSAFFMIASVCLSRKCFAIYETFHKELVDMQKENNNVLYTLTRLLQKK